MELYFILSVGTLSLIQVKLCFCAYLSVVCTADHFGLFIRMSVAFNLPKSFL